MRKKLPRIKDHRDFLPRGYDIVLGKIRKDSRERLKNLGILP